MTATIRTWTTDPLDAEVRAALERLAEADDVAAIAVMPDVHLAHGVCIGTVTATHRRIYPSAVGGDIGCGVAGLRLGVAAAVLSDREAAAAVLAGLYARVPFIKHATSASPEVPATPGPTGLSSSALVKLAAQGSTTRGRGPTRHHPRFDGRSELPRGGSRGA